MSEPYRARHQYFGRVARDYDSERRRTLYDRWKWERERAALARVLEAFGGTGRALDVPTGTGRFLDLLADGERRAIGCDVSPAMLALARSRAGARAVPLACAEAERLPFPDGVLDLVVSIRFFQHLPPTAVGPILRELVRVSARGVVLQAPLANRLSPLVRLAADALRGRRGRAARPARRDRYFPTDRASFESDLARWGLELATCRPVTWRGGQLRLMHVRRSAAP